MRASQYFWLIARRALANSSGRIKRAVAGDSVPVIFPRIVHGAIVTRGLLRMRLHFPDLLLVMKQSLPFSSANQIGVCTTAAFLRKVPGLMYSWFRISL